jgi:hypothetical protein
VPVEETFRVGRPVKSSTCLLVTLVPPPQPFFAARALQFGRLERVVPMNAGFKLSGRARMSKSEIDQTKDGIIAITVCIAQILAKSDPTFAACLEARLAAWSGALSEFGEGHGAALVWSVRQALHDPKYFPSE